MQMAKNGVILLFYAQYLCSDVCEVKFLDDFHLIIDVLPRCGGIVERLLFFKKSEFLDFVFLVVGVVGVGRDDDRIKLAMGTEKCR
jgi:hypothetical protein